MWFVGAVAEYQNLIYTFEYMKSILRRTKGRIHSMTKELKEADLFNTKNNLEVLASVAIFVAVLVVFYLFVQWIGLDRLQAWVQDSGPFAPVVFIIIQALSIILAPTSATSVMVIGGITFDNWWVMLYVYLGSMLGFSTNFWLARIFGRGIVRRVAGEDDIQRIDKVVKAIGPSTIIVLPLFLFFMIDFLSYVAGFTKVDFKKYIAVVAVVTLFLAYGSVFVGSSLG
jgi:uncharacterized membrane protein YdjX (TVP38/TMEM64 family)